MYFEYVYSSACCAFRRSYSSIYSIQYVAFVVTIIDCSVNDVTPGHHVRPQARGATAFRHPICTPPRSLHSPPALALSLSLSLSYLLTLLPCRLPSTPPSLHPPCRLGPYDDFPLRRSLPVRFRPCSSSNPDSLRLSSPASAGLGPSISLTNPLLTIPTTTIAFTITLPLFRPLSCQRAWGKDCLSSPSPHHSFSSLTDRSPPRWRPFLSRPAP